MNMTFLFFECDEHVWKVGGIHLTNAVHYSGSDWMGLNREFVSYIIEEKDELVDGMKQFFNYMANPCESFFHTVIRNSRFCSTCVSNNLHLINWKREIGCGCKSHSVVDYCGCSPNGNANDISIYISLDILYNVL